MRHRLRPIAVAALTTVTVIGLLAALAACDGADVSLVSLESAPSADQRFALAGSSHPDLAQDAPSAPNSNSDTRSTSRRSGLWGRRNESNQDSTPPTTTQTPTTTPATTTSTTSTLPHPTTTTTTATMPSAPTTTAPQPPPAAATPSPRSAPTDGATASELNFLACVRWRESRNNYGVVSANGLYYGAYQFLRSTWDSTARHAGRADLIGVPPNLVPPADQDAMALHLLRWQGTSPWGGACR